MDTKAIMAVYDELSEETQEWVDNRVKMMQENYRLRYEKTGDIAFKGLFGGKASMEALFMTVRYLYKLKEKER